MTLPRAARRSCTVAAATRVGGNNACGPDDAPMPRTQPVHNSEPLRQLRMLRDQPFHLETKDITVIVEHPEIYGAFVGAQKRIVQSFRAHMNRLSISCSEASKDSAKLQCSLNRSESCQQLQIEALTSASAKARACNRLLLLPLQDLLALETRPASPEAIRRLEQEASKQCVVEIKPSTPSRPCRTSRKTHRHVDPPQATHGSERNSKRRRKNFSSNAVAVLNKWYEDHKEDPFPNAEEKFILGEQTRLTYDQISNWYLFSNASLTDAHKYSHVYRFINKRQRGETASQ